MDIDSNIAEVRSEFPVLRYKTYLNSAAHGPAMRRVWDAVQEWWRFRMDENRGYMPPDAKGEALKLINASAEEICWISRVTQGLNIIAGMVKAKKGENIVVTETGYPSNVFVWLPQRQDGAEIRRIKTKEGRIETADFEKAIDDKTKAVSMTRVEWTTGQLNDVKAISEAAHEHGALVIDDCYQAAGAVEMDVHSDDVDFLVFGSEKWLCCPCMNGVFYIRADLIDQFEPAYRFYDNVEEAFRGGAPWGRPEHDNISDYSKPFYRSAGKFNRGCVSGEDVWAFHASLSYFNGLGVGNIQRRVRRLSGYLIDGLRDLGVTVNTPLEPSERGGLVTYTTGRHELNKRSHETLTRNNIVTALRYQHGVGGIRVSTHFFNTEEDIDRLLKVQRGLLS